MRQSHILNYSGNSALSSQVSPSFGKFGSIVPSFPIIREVLMNNTNSTNHSKQLRTWAKIINDCKVAKASGTTVKDWLKANNISHDTYYYWYAEVKKAYVNDSLLEIASVDNKLVSCIMLSINDVSILKYILYPFILKLMIRTTNDDVFPFVFSYHSRSSNKFFFYILRQIFCQFLHKLINLCPRCNICW